MMIRNVIATPKRFELLLSKETANQERIAGRRLLGRCKRRLSADGVAKLTLTTRPKCLHATLELRMLWEQFKLEYI